MLINIKITKGSMPQYHMTQKDINDTITKFPNFGETLTHITKDIPHIRLPYLSNSGACRKKLNEFICILDNYMNVITRHYNFYINNTKFKSRVGSRDNIIQNHTFMRNKWKILKCMHDCCVTELIIIKLIYENTNNKKRIIQLEQRITLLKQRITEFKQRTNDIRKEADDLCAKLEKMVHEKV